MQTPLSSRLVYEGRVFDVTVDRVEVGAFSVDEIRAMIASGEIADLKTVAGLTFL